MLDNFAIAHTTKNYPQNAYQEMKDKILGKKYSLSLTFIGTKRASELNKKYRQKNYTPNVLSFPLSKNAGEVFITPSIIKTESKKFNMTQKGYAAFLFIHACLHLKGMVHGDTMEKAEKKYCTMFNLC